jgi:hypothetical protein
MSLYCDNIVICSEEKLERLKERLLTNDKILIKKNDFLEKFAHTLNYKQDPIDERDFKLSATSEILLEADLPDNVDHTKDMSPIKDQGQLGSCVSFAVAAMKEWQEKKEHEAEMAKGKPGRKKVYNYSEAWIYWNCKKIDPWPGEEGTSIRYAMKVLKKIGVPTEKGWPYKDVGDIGKPESWAPLVARWALIDSYSRIDTLNELKFALISGPVPIGIPCFEEIFYVGSDGIIPYPENPNYIYGGHAVCAVGFDNEKKLIKFRNSWSKHWGENGYGYLPYDYIDDFLWDAWTSKDLSVTKDMLKGGVSL